MLLGIYKKIKCALKQDNTVSTNPNSQTMGLLSGVKVNFGEYHDINNEVYDGLALFCANGAYVWPNPLNYTNITGIIGSSSTPVSIDDYKLGSKHDITVNIAQACNLDENYNTVSTYTLTGTNTTANAITISEVGLYGSFMAYRSATTYPDRGLLLVREVLSQPITVEPGSGFRIIIEIVED